MTGSLAEVRAVLAGVSEQIGTAYEQAAHARARLADALAVLTELGEQHSESLVPDELPRAGDELDRALGLVGAAALVVADVGARL